MNEKPQGDFEIDSWFKKFFDSHCGFWIIHLKAWTVHRKLDNLHPVLTTTSVTQTPASLLCGYCCHVVVSFFVWNDIFCYVYL